MWDHRIRLLCSPRARLAMVAAARAILDLDSIIQPVTLVAALRCFPGLLLIGSEERDRKLIGLRQAVGRVSVEGGSLRDVTSMVTYFARVACCADPPAILNMASPNVMVTDGSGTHDHANMEAHAAVVATLKLDCWRSLSPNPGVPEVLSEMALLMFQNHAKSFGEMRLPLADGLARSGREDMAQHLLDYENHPCGCWVLCSLIDGLFES